MAGPQLVDGAQWVSYDEQVYIDEAEKEKDACKKSDQLQAICEL
jgi:hypothetical protein